MSEEEKERERANDRARKRKSRALRSFEEDEIERAQSRERKRLKRLRMTEEEKERERSADRERKRKLRQLEADRKTINSDISLRISIASSEQILDEVKSTMDAMLSFLVASDIVQGYTSSALETDISMLDVVAKAVYIPVSTPVLYPKKPRGRKPSETGKVKRGNSEKKHLSERKVSKKKKEIDPNDALLKKIYKEQAILAKARDRKRITREELGIHDSLDSEPDSYRTSLPITSISVASIPVTTISSMPNSSMTTIPIFSTASTPTALLPHLPTVALPLSLPTMSSLPNTTTSMTSQSAVMTSINKGSTDETNAYIMTKMSSDITNNSHILLQDSKSIIIYNDITPSYSQFQSLSSSNLSNYNTENKSVTDNINNININNNNVIVNTGTQIQGHTGSERETPRNATEVSEIVDSMIPTEISVSPTVD
eukprot:CAMPEP_0182419222 /NCGR_PEP_ID=MMETSP1167-20130531/3640_1 /TAXON_ID=2988 /ORGANISM="Mallomonas Sp, Strain CCMP3275" /LENGTH=427 /DNA_ID=CAMNT_0024593947 /DNA_START=126 /DNA_END=1406 /DNA_ORIENTATION=-